MTSFNSNQKWKIVPAFNSNNTAFPHTYSKQTVQLLLLRMMRRRLRSVKVPFRKKKESHFMRNSQGTVDIYSYVQQCMEQQDEKKFVRSYSAS